MDKDHGKRAFQELVSILFELRVVLNAWPADPIESTLQIRQLAKRLILAKQEAARFLSAYGPVPSSGAICFSRPLPSAGFIAESAIEALKLIADDTETRLEKWELGIAALEANGGVTYPECRFLGIAAAFGLSNALIGSSSDMICAQISSEIRQMEPPKQDADLKKPRRRNRRPAISSAIALTAKQLEAVSLYGECSGNMSEVARRMGVKPATAKQHYDTANEKLGIKAGELARTKTLSSDHLGQGVKIPRKSDRL